MQTGIRSVLLCLLGLPVSYAAAPSIALSPATAALRPGDTQAFSARLTGVGQANLAWQLSPALGTIDAAGKYTAPAAPPGSASTVTVKAYDKTQPTVASTATVSLLNPAPSIASLTPGVINQNVAYIVSLKNAGFLTNSQVLFDGKPVASQFVSSTEL